MAEVSSRVLCKGAKLYALLRETLLMTGKVDVARARSLREAMKTLNINS